MSSFERPISWLGLMVEDMIVDRNMGTGAFSHLFRGCGLTLPVNAVFKLARENSELIEAAEWAAPPPIRTQALAFFTGGYYPVVADAAFLLANQYEKLNRVKDSGLVEVHHLARFGGSTYMRMAYLDGESFRFTVANGGARLVHFVELAGILKRLSANEDFLYHGDLKPENIMHTGRGLRLIDSGYFGFMQCEDGEVEVAVTTPCYYPALRPDDLFAFGLMLFEAATGFHPLIVQENSALSALQCYPLSVQFREQLDLLNDLGFPDLEPLARLPVINQLAPHLRPEIVRLLLSCLRLQIGPDGLLVDKIFFADFAELEAHMLKLQGLGLDIG